MLGGLSTFLGILPLMLASSDIILVWVLIFFSLVVLGEFFHLPSAALLASLSLSLSSVLTLLRIVASSQVFPMV